MKMFIPPCFVPAHVRGMGCHLIGGFVSVSFNVGADRDHPESIVRFRLDEHGARFLIEGLTEALAHPCLSHSAGSDGMPSVEGSTPDGGESQ
jgi:hypothetical protein